MEMFPFAALKKSSKNKQKNVGALTNVRCFLVDTLEVDIAMGF